MEKCKWMVFLHIVEKLDLGEVNDQRGKEGGTAIRVVYAWLSIH